MEFINALDYNIKKQVPAYDYISLITINGQEVSTEMLLDISISSYGKQVISYKLCPGVSKLLELLTNNKYCEISILYAKEESDFLLNVTTEYDHFIIHSDAISIVFYTKYKDDVKIEESTPMLRTYIKE